MNPTTPEERDRTRSVPLNFFIHKRGQKLAALALVPDFKGQGFKTKLDLCPANLCVLIRDLCNSQVLPNEARTAPIVSVPRFAKA